MEYTCDICNFRTFRAYDLKVHEKTVKHKRNVGTIELEKYINEKNDDKNEQNNKIINVSNEKTMIFPAVRSNEKIIENIDDFTENGKKKPKKVYLCKYCGKHFNFYQGMWSHMKICKCKSLFDEQKTTQEHVTKLTKTVEDLKSLIETKLNQVIVPQQIITPPPININMTDNSVNTNNMSNVVKYINQNYHNAQPLEMLLPTQAKNLLVAQSTKKHSVEELMIYYFEKHTLDKFIGKIIKDEYKKQEPDKQQFWSTDVSRLSFLVRRVMKENDKIWVNDKKGSIVMKHIITPILLEVKGMIDKYQTYCKYILETQAFTLQMDELEKIGNNSIICEDLSNALGGDLIHNLVLKYISPCFQLEG